MKKINLTLKRLMSFAGVAAMLVFASCGDDDGGGDPAPTQTMTEIINSDSGGSDGLDSLSKYLNKYPDLVATLSASGEATIFAPTNSAFISLLQTPGFPQNILDIDPDIIKGVLAYHIVPGQTVLSSEIVGGASFNTAYTDLATSAVQVIEVNDDGTLLTGSTNEEISIITADIEATNGVVHKVESVMIPPTVGDSLTPILGTIAGTVLLGADFTYLADLIGVADADVPTGEAPVSGMLASSGQFTAFLPPNAVFEGAAEAQGITVAQFVQSFDAGSARAVLLTHLTTDGTFATSDMSNGQTFTAASGVTLTIVIAGSNTLVTAPGNSEPVPLVPGNTDINHSNGIVHVIGGILQPQ